MYLCKEAVTMDLFEIRIFYFKYTERYAMDLGMRYTQLF